MALITRICWSVFFSSDWWKLSRIIILHFSPLIFSRMYIQGFRSNEQSSKTFRNKTIPHCSFSENRFPLRRTGSAWRGDILLVKSQRGQYKVCLDISTGCVTQRVGEVVFVGEVSSADQKWTRCLLPCLSWCLSSQQVGRHDELATQSVCSQSVHLFVAFSDPVKLVTCCHLY